MRWFKPTALGKIDVDGCFSRSKCGIFCCESAMEAVKPTVPPPIMIAGYIFFFFFLCSVVAWSEKMFSPNPGGRGMDGKYIYYESYTT